MTIKQQQEFFQKLMNRKNNTSFETFVYRYLKDDKKNLRLPGLTQLLLIDNSLLTEDGKEAINYLESLIEPEGQIFSFSKFKWKILAFLAVQDLLTTPIYEGGIISSILQQKYFYYESKYILLEVIISSLNGLHIGNKQLMRNFLEFNMLQCYFINKINKEKSFQSFNEYLKTRINPSVSKLINEAVPVDNFCKPIKKRLQIELQNLSNRYSHAYNQNDSPKHDGIFRPGLTIESLYFHIQVAATLDIVLWMYYVNFPMLFKPVNIVKKFGFSPPALFVTPDVTAVIEQTMSKEDFAIFENYASNSEVVQGNLQWYNSLPDLSEDEIWRQWDKPREKDDTIEGCFLKMIATVRGYSELLFESEEMRKERSAQVNAVTDSVLENYTVFSKWQKVYKNFKTAL